MGLSKDYLKDYFFDSYALIELIKGNSQYLKYGECVVTITLFNLVEVVYAIFNEFGEEKAHEIYKKFEDCVHDIDYEITIEALKLKQKYKKRNLSYADCIGYAFAKRHTLFFLTGDKGFEDLENVEFVRK